jgi:hypothetical protein
MIMPIDPLACEKKRFLFHIPADSFDILAERGSDIFSFGGQQWLR